MPLGRPPCPRCHRNIFVRMEQVISGRRTVRAYYCGRCDYDWQVEGTPPAHTSERRQGERRKARLAEAAKAAETQTAAATIKSKSERKKAV